ncbi:MAG TPA: DNA circularization N-terminal domain-containing protein [Lacunisphaera sp.]|nr:DNA circularization N-terminal domain-containing protein [Lacunisphaera sp.]
MPNVFEGMPLASFEGAEFPWENYSIVGGVRDHIHEYPHQDGGDTEHLGRKLYEIRISPTFQAGLLPERYARLFPDRLRALRKLFENQTVGELVLPHIGSMKAKAISWTESARSNNIGGVEVDWMFREDMSGVFGTTFVILTNNLKSCLADWQIEADSLPERPSIFDEINDVALQVLAVKGQADMYGGLIAAKVDGLISLLQLADTTVPDLGEPDNYGLLEQMGRLMSATVELGRDVAEKGKALQVFTVPMTMSVGDISSAVYKGDSTRGTEIMQLNTLFDPLAVPAGERVVYYG